MHHWLWYDIRWDIFDWKIEMISQKRSRKPFNDIYLTNETQSIKKMHFALWKWDNIRRIRKWIKYWSGKWIHEFCPINPFFRKAKPSFFEASNTPILLFCNYHPRIKPIHWKRSRISNECAKVRLVRGSHDETKTWNTKHWFTKKTKNIISLYKGRVERFSVNLPCKKV
jgi:hypothetical protein